MNFLSIFRYTILIVGLSCCKQNTLRSENNTHNNSLKSDADKMITHYPFVIEDPGRFRIEAQTEGELYPKYAEFFEKYGYSGNGYCWEGHIKEILIKIDPELLTHITFDPEAGAFYAFADTKENQMRFVKLLSPIFADLELLADYVKKADRSKIDD
jgi:hypothetical protein